MKELESRKHHYTFNHSEDGEVMDMNHSSHVKLHTDMKLCSNEMSIRRDIIYKLLIRIPKEDIQKIVHSVVENLRNKCFISANINSKNMIMTKRQQAGMNEKNIEATWDGLYDGEVVWNEKTKTFVLQTPQKRVMLPEN